MKLKLLNGATATNGIPTLPTAGVPIRKGADGLAPDLGGLSASTDRAVLLLWSTAGTGTMTVTIRLWGWSEATTTWHPFGTGATDDVRGKINEGNAIGEIGGDPDKLRHSEVIEGLTAFDRIYCEVTAIGGTGTAVHVGLVARS